MRRAVVVIAAAGCQGVFGVRSVGVPVDAAADASRFTCGMPVLADEFDLAVPCAPWGTFFASGSASAAEGSGSLTFTIDNGGEARCATTNDIAVPAGGFAVAAVQTPAGATSYMSLASSALGVELSATAGLLKFSRPGGTGSFASVQYNAAQMQFWRITPAGDHATAAYSRDGIEWVDMSATAPLTLPLPASVDIVIKAGAVGVIAPTTGVFEHLIACP